MLSPFVSQQLRGLVSKETSADLQVLGEYVQAGKLIPIIDRAYSLSEVPQAIQYVEDGHARGKVVISL
jgi:NADPH:quinone reductase-like Zn-dependent oxidoreductase